MAMWGEDMPFACLCKAACVCAGVRQSQGRNPWVGAVLATRPARQGAGRQRQDSPPRDAALIHLLDCTGERQTW